MSTFDCISSSIMMMESSEVSLNGLELGVDMDPEVESRPIGLGSPLHDTPQMLVGGQSSGSMRDRTNVACKLLDEGGTW